MYKGLLAKRFYAENVGNIGPSRYGLNSHWDLGLCKVHFTLGDICRDADCEFRHDDSTIDEKVYMRFLGILSTSFLECSTEICMRKGLQC